MEIGRARVQGCLAVALASNPMYMVYMVKLEANEQEEPVPFLHIQVEGI